MQIYFLHPDVLLPLRMHNFYYLQKQNYTEVKGMESDINTVDVILLNIFPHHIAHMDASITVRPEKPT